MDSAQNRDSCIILRDVHCPYCNTDKALLMSRKSTSTIGLRLPAYGLRYILSLLYLSVLHMWRYGYKIIEISKGREYSAYGFCPNCGNSYSAGAPDEVKAEVNDPKLYRVRKGKSITGFCKGISEYTDIPVLWIRIITAIYGLTVVGAFFYFLIAVCIPFKEDVESGAIENKRFYLPREGKVIMGLCMGISVYTEISVVWIRILAVILALSIFPIVLYFICGGFAKTEEQVYGRQ